MKDMARHNQKGEEAEKAAVEFLENRAYLIREVNWRHCHKEIDIIAEFEGKLIIVEVKSRQQGSFSDASELLSTGKMRNLVDAAEAYIFKFNIIKEVRFDLIIVIYDPLGVKIQHIPGAFIPGVNW